MHLVEDAIFEGEEQFVVRLANPLGFEQCGARVGTVDRITVTITDPQDGKWREQIEIYVVVVVVFLLTT